MTTVPAVLVRPARPEEYSAAGALVADAYVADGHTAADSPYLAELRAADRRAGEAELLVAVAGAPGDRDRVVGSVTFALAGSPWADLAVAGEAEFRMLVVDPAARGTGVGEALVRACLDRARAAGARALVLSTQPDMRAAHRLYARLGFLRLPDRDWSPQPGMDLLAYGLEL